MSSATSPMRGMVDRSSDGSLLRLHAVRKAFGPVQALESVDLEVGCGEVHALVGENGAGKSTLMKILSGACHPDDGSIIFNGVPYVARNPADARLAGIAMIYQELTLALHLTVEENITLGIEHSRYGLLSRQTQRVKDVLARMGHEDLDPDIPVAELSINLRQIVEIARALMCDAHLIIMDEPTSSLSAEDKVSLFQTV
ncbi:MAG: sugar ABC transporter ATP-binding protein, partial [Lentisphaerae bacterium]|nr:sugar ABC transporter ATP-binding protein [Lentisphaerota bacterium]